MDSLANSKLSQLGSRKPWVQGGLLGRWRDLAGIWGDLRVWGAGGMSVWVLCVQKAPIWSSQRVRTHGVNKGGRDPDAGDRGAILVLRGSVNVHVVVNL